MKKILLPVALINVCAVSGAFAMPAHFYANGIVGHNIGVFQHSIFQNAIDNLGNDKIYVTKADKKQNTNNIDVYGKMPVYGEYGDDGTVFGRSGGDSLDNGLWLSWNYASDYVKFDNMDKIDTRSNVAVAGASSDFGRFGRLGAFAGYAGSKQSNASVDINENGGFIGIYNGYQFGRLKLNAMLDGGAISNSADTGVGTDSFSNIWLGAGVNASYDLVVDNTFVVQPVVYGMYTWVRTPNYTSVSGQAIDSENLSLFEVVPGVRFIKNVVGNWYGIASAKFVGLFDNAAKTKVDGVAIDDLTMGHYAEYGISLEKRVYNFNISVNINRRDGSYTGWNGGVNLKYIF